MEKLNIDDFGTDLPTQLMQPYENHPQSNNREAVETDDIQWGSYLNDIDYNSNCEPLPLDEMPPLEETKDVYKEDDKTRLNVSVEGEFSRTEETFLLEETMSEQLVEQLMTDPCERKISTSLKINEMSNTSTKRKRKKSNSEGGDKSIPFCNCKKSRCLKLYCECLSAGVYCTKDCGCTDCMNQEIYEDTVKAEKQRIQSKNPFAFAPKNVRGNEATLKKRCKCKQSMCRKKYCECFQAGIGCTIACGCGSCQNPFGIRQGSNNIVQRNINDRTTNLRGLSPASEYMQLPNNLSPTFSNNLSSLNNHTPDTPTSNVTNGNGDSEASNLAPDAAHIYELLYGNFEISYLLQQMLTENEMVRYHQPSNFVPQSCVTMSSNRPPRSNHLPHRPSTSYIQEELSSNSMLDFRGNHLGEGLSSNLMLGLRGNHLGEGSSSNLMLGLRGNHLGEGLSSNSMLGLRGNHLGERLSLNSMLSLRGNHLGEGSSLNSMLGLRRDHLGEGSSSNWTLGLRGNQQGVDHIMPDFTSTIPYRNSNGSSFQNGGDRRNFPKF